MSAVTVRYHVYIYGHWQYGINRLDLAMVSAQELASRKRKLVDVFERKGTDADSEVLLKTIYPEKLDKLFAEFQKAA